ncbi:hypothetical protein GCM10007159_07570 [Modicisalibacter luteus]|nr:hypothetical protein GCM10007159_07570 [Halomonas lutea]
MYDNADYTGIGKYLDEEKDDPDSQCCVVAKRNITKTMDNVPLNAAVGDRDAQGQHPHQGRAPCFRLPDWVVQWFLSVEFRNFVLLRFV